MKIQLAFASAAALALAACGSNQTADQTTAEATATDTAAATPTPTATPPQGFIDAAAASDMFEIEAAKLAQAQSKSDKVKAFAEMMIKDHTASSDKLKKAVQEAGNGLAVTPALTPAQQGQLDQLRSAGETFDALYAQQQVHAHEDALKLLQEQAANGTVAQLKDFAGQIAPTVETHLEHARELP